MFPFALDRKTESEGTYPIVLVSYLIACTEYDSADEAAAVKGFLEYAISPEGQELAAENAGSAPLSAALTSKITPASKRSKPVRRRVTRSIPRPTQVNCWRRRPEGAAASATASSPVPRSSPG